MKNTYKIKPMLILALLFFGCKNGNMIEPISNPRLIAWEGQSNAIGLAPGAELPSDLTGPIAGARIFYGDSQGLNWNNYSFQPLQYNVNNDGTAGLASQFRDHFGAELRVMKMLHDYFGGTFSLLKCGEGGTSLAHRTGLGPARRDWSPDSPGQFYDISNAYRAAGVARSGGKPPCCYVWTQGEDDANAVNYGQGPVSGQYQNLLINRVAAVRTFHNYPEMPFYIVRLGNLQTLLDTSQRNIIRAAQQYVAANIPNVYIIDADSLPVQEDGIHYTAPSYDTLAHRIFNAIINAIPVVRPLVLFPFNAGSFQSLGYDQTNTQVIQKIFPNKVVTWKPDRLINGITGFEIGSSYLGKITGTAKPGKDCYMPQY